MSTRGLQYWRRKARDMAKALNVEINALDSAKGGTDISLDPPTFKVFAATACHSCVSADWDATTDEERAECWQAICDDLAKGLEDCEDPECEYCHE